MEKILDEWTPYASLDHVGGTRAHGYSQTVRHNEGGSGNANNKFLIAYNGPAVLNGVQNRSTDLQVLGSTVGKKIEGRHHVVNDEAKKGCALHIMNGIRNDVVAQRKPNKENEFHDTRQSYIEIKHHVPPMLKMEKEMCDTVAKLHDDRSHDIIKAWHDSKGIRWGSSTRSKLFLNEDKWIVRDVRGQFYRGSFINNQGAEIKDIPWTHSSDNRKIHIDKRRRSGSVESRVAKKREERQRRGKENWSNWLTEDTLKKIEDYHSDEYTDNTIKGNKTANKSTQVKFEKKPSKAMTFDRGRRNWKTEDGGNEEDFRFVKRGIRFWDGNKREPNEELEDDRGKRVRASSSSSKHEEKKGLRVEELAHREGDNVWAKKADKNIRMKNQKERKLDAVKIRFSNQEKNTGTKKERIYGTTRGIHDRGNNYWRIGHGDKGMSKELKVIRISDEQLTSF